MDKTAWLRQIRCTPLERGAVDALAEREGISLADAQRRLVREGAKAEGVWPNSHRTLSDERPAYRLGFRPGESVYISRTLHTHKLGIAGLNGFVDRVNLDGSYRIIARDAEGHMHGPYDLNVSELEHATTAIEQEES